MSSSLIPVGTLVRVNLPNPSGANPLYHGRLGFVDEASTTSPYPHTVRMLDDGAYVMLYRDECEVAGGDTYITKDTTT